MFAKSNQKVDVQKIDWLHTQAVAKHKQGEIEEAIAYYQESIEICEKQPVWVYGNTIIILTQLGCLDEALKLGDQALKIYPNEDEIFRALGILFYQENNLEKAKEFYLKAIECNPDQAEWVYVNLINILVKTGYSDQALNIKQKALSKFPQSDNLKKFIDLKSSGEKSNSLNKISYIEINKELLFTFSKSREAPEDIDNIIDLDISSIRRRLMDSAIIDRYQVILNQILFSIHEGVKEMDFDALVYCLAEIKTDIHYIKTKLSNPSPEAVDPQAKQNVDLDKIINLPKPVPIKCELKDRIIGSGWHEAEEHGRWTGPGIISSVILPYPITGKYKFEMIVRSEAKPDLLKTLHINVNDKPLEISIIQHQDYASFPAIIQGEIITSQDQNQSFMTVDLIVEQTFSLQEADSRYLGILVEKISLIPHFLLTK